MSGTPSGGDGNATEPVENNKVLAEFTLAEVAKRIKDGLVQNIIVMTGAGISVAAGIPDFRSPGTGLYAQLEKYDLPHPTSIFDIEYFRENPEPFYVLAKEMWPGNYDPTDAHLFIKLLEEKKILLRNYTQNIDCLERAAKVNPDYLVECHGTFATAHTIDHPIKEIPIDQIKKRLDAGETNIRDPETDSLIKPDIVFFGERLPDRFFSLLKIDFDRCDLLLVMGTSLTVHPFASLTRLVKPKCPRVLINNQPAGDFRFEHEDNERDVGVMGDIQESVNKFVELLGWEKEFGEIKRRFPNRRSADAPSILPELAGLSLKSSPKENLKDTATTTTSASNNTPTAPPPSETPAA